MFLQLLILVRIVGIKPFKGSGYKQRDKRCNMTSGELALIKAKLKANDRRRAEVVANAISRAASRQREANRNGQRDMGAQKQDQERTATTTGDTYRIGRSPSLLDRCIEDAANVDEQEGNTDGNVTAQ